jgi:hypothetical protein
MPFGHMELLTYVRSHGHKALAASCFYRHRFNTTSRWQYSTFTQQFEIPIDLLEYSTCSISKQSKLGKLLETIEMIIWDEAPMTHKFTFEALDQTLRDLRNSQEPMGGITTVLCGDFHQNLPIIPKGSRPDIVNATLKRSSLWKHVKHMSLKKHMRLNEDSQRWDELNDGSNNCLVPEEFLNSLNT